MGVLEILGLLFVASLRHEEKPQNVKYFELKQPDWDFVNYQLCLSYYISPIDMEDYCQDGMIYSLRGNSLMVSFFLDI